jgi:beta-galactosidase beta subunit
MKTGKLDDLKNNIDIDFFNKIMNFVEIVKLNNVSIGEWNMLSEDSLKAIVLNKSNTDSNIKEYHKVYTDVHITIHGLDTMFFGNKIIETVDEYQENGDYSLVKSETIGSNKIFPNYFMLLKPEEIHCNILNENSLKVVIKIK